MSNLEMEIYNAFNGVRRIFYWANEEDYKLGYKFLIGIGAMDVPADGPMFFILETEEQLESLYVFRKSLREKNKQASPPPADEKDADHPA